MIARLAYLSLYKKHQLALHGFVWVAFATLANPIKRRTEPRPKLHCSFGFRRRPGQRRPMSSWDPTTPGLQIERAADLSQPHLILGR